MQAKKQVRLETGVLRAEGDWPGVFIRGKDAVLAYAPHLEAVLKRARDFDRQGGAGESLEAAQDIRMVEELLELLRDSMVRPGQIVTNDLKSFEEIKK